MNKFIVALDGLHFSSAATTYAVELAQSNAAFLTGVFLDDRTFSSYKIYDLVLKDGVSESKIKHLRQQDTVIRKQSSDYFVASAQKASLNFNVHHDHNVALQELIHESIYADLLIIDQKESLSHYDEKHPSRFIRDVLADAQCPVLVVPSEYKSIQKIVFLFDGTPSSVFAIKLFSYLLPRFSELSIDVVSVKPMEEDVHLPDNTLVKELLKRHYKQVNYFVLKGISETEIVQYFSTSNAASIVVTGAYRRSDLSRWFKPSIADILIKNFHLPLFVAHSK